MTNPPSEPSETPGDPELPDDPTIQPSSEPDTKPIVIPDPDAQPGQMPDSTNTEVGA